VRVLLILRVGAGEEGIKKVQEGSVVLFYNFRTVSRGGGLIN
jgi:hypothetical protein